ncbi:hypothetical protein HIM_08628 [Hirsutella minnesotensis 3608]|uniref:AB hydrolase-1 domain-containing protein n=1 Tax=Hirsutella minnesotensis 3608 TaxID=1043627 RepID=A0A0F7ZSU0_9HYPO|nr:hypothetical protein HIM_08628 [Hirsutella minnesotensis 3608]
MATPGILFVTMQPRPDSGLALSTFHSWYDNEHGPDRLRRPRIFTNGLRRPPREARVIALVDVCRRPWDLVADARAPHFTPLQNLPDDAALGLLAVALDITPAPQLSEDAHRTWFLEQHVGALSDTPGWLRSRLFKPSAVEDSSPHDEPVYFALHDFAPDTLLDHVQFSAPGTTLRRSDWSLFYTFGPAPRDLEALSREPPGAEPFTSPDGLTSTVPGADPVISSYVTTADSLRIPYRLEGNPSPDAPTVALCNSLLTSLRMWDALVGLVKRHRPDLRILRYDARGRHDVPQPPVDATLDILAADLVQLLDALRIPRLHALVGVSLGGATALRFALAYPSRLDRFVACDFNASSSAANTQAWKDRVAVAEEDGGAGIRKLAEQTVARWFHPSSLQNADLVRGMTEMVATNNVNGFKHSCTALWDYDLKPEMSGCSVPGLFAVGDQDAKGALVQAMGTFKEMLGSHGAELKIVPGAGHLPMCEQPEAFWECIRHFI